MGVSSDDRKCHKSCLGSLRQLYGDAAVRIRVLFTCLSVGTLYIQDINITDVGFCMTHTAQSSTDIHLAGMWRFGEQSGGRISY